MTRTQHQAKKLTDKINLLTKQTTPVRTIYRVRDDSVQAELRLSATWSIRYPVDEIHAPKNLEGKWDNPLWVQMREIISAISSASDLRRGEKRTTIPISERTKTGPEKRAEAKAAFAIESGRQFLADYKSVTGKRALALIRAQITTLHAGQKALLPQLREANSLYLAGLRSAKEEQTRKNTEALASGRFWEADKYAIKGYFHPPFDKNYLADVSEKWRAALFLECQSVSYKTNYGNWGHKLAGTGNGYLCGIDDNGDEWGIRVADLPQSHDDYGDAGLDSTVEEAMCNLFDITQAKLATCQRQGDLLFCPTKTITEPKIVCGNCGQSWEPITKPSTDPDDPRPIIHCTHCESWWQTDDSTTIFPPTRTIQPPVFKPEEKWEVRESHEIWSPGLQHNGRFFRSAQEIMITHTSHATVVLPPGVYRLYELPVEDAD